MFCVCVCLFDVLVMLVGISVFEIFGYCILSVLLHFVGLVGVSFDCGLFAISFDLWVLICWWNCALFAFILVWLSGMLVLGNFAYVRLFSFGILV